MILHRGNMGDHRDDAEEAVVERMEEIRAKKQRFQTLVALPEWKEYAAIIEAQIILRRTTEFATPINSMDAAFLSATAKAEIGALQLAINMPELYIKDMENDLANAVIELENLQPIEQEG